MHLLDNVIQTYDWGSHKAIAELQGRPVPSAQPEAELWMGAHPAAPSRVRSSGESLCDLVTKDPDAILGALVRAQFDGFPFLLKILAAEQPLSLQAHPSKAQAEAGYADEEARGTSRSAPDRNYKDRNHKPELLCALTRFEALCGFRAPSELVTLLDLLAVPELAPERAAVAGRGAPLGMRDAFRSVMERTGADRDALVKMTLAACRVHASGKSPFTPALAWALRLAELHPGDVGAVSALFLNHLVLEPGQAIYLAAGNLHAYLGGVGVEIMASSDNVLRGGLTSKHVDLGALLSVLDFTAGSVLPVPVDQRDATESVYRTPATDFQLSRLVLSSARPFTAALAGPEILLCTEGHLIARAGAGTKEGVPLALRRGDAALALANDERYALEGQAVVYRASVGSRRA